MKRLDWSSLDAAGREAALARPPASIGGEVRAGARRIIDQVRADGDHALRALTRRFDGVEIDAITLTADEIEAGAAQVGAELAAAIDAAAARIEAFHAAGRVPDYGVDTAPGVRCERVARPIRRVGLYVPAGSAPLPSTALMLGVPARLAGCPEITLASPPDREGRVDAAVLHVARRLGIGRVARVGGAQAIAALAYGTASLPRCDKLFGPGNAWVTAAKMEVAMDPQGAAIDMPAGPSELLVIADAGATPAFVAADLLSQAEHGPDSQVLLLSDDAALLEAMPAAIERQLADLPRADIARRALANSRAIRFDSLDAAFAASNAYAPEHLILALRQPRDWLDRVASAGSVFLGDFTPESLGDYCSGTNHVLPTYGAARAFSGVSLASFQTFMTVQQASAEGLAAIGPDAATMARAERLEAHARAVTLRLARREAA